MAEHKTTARIAIPEECEEPIEELEIFFRTNQYKTIDKDETSAKFKRGEKGRGFWTSDLTVLPVELEIELVGELVTARYVVNTTGQRLNEDERGFWNREAAAATTFLETGQPQNLVDEERDRADKLRSDFMRRGIYIGLLSHY